MVLPWRGEMAGSCSDAVRYHDIFSDQRHSPIGYGYKGMIGLERNLVIFEDKHFNDYINEKVFVESSQPIWLLIQQ